MNAYTLALILAVLLLAPPLRLAWIGWRDSGTRRPRHYGAVHRIPQGRHAHRYHRGYEVRVNEHVDGAYHMRLEAA